MNLFESIPAALPQEIVETLLDSENVRIERIVSRGHVSPDGFWYDQEQAEWVLLVHGAARVGFENSSRELKPGDFLHIPAHQKHRVEWTTTTESTIWLAIHYG
jgi:cupin 2 domain-containing protein